MRFLPISITSWSLASLLSSITFFSYLFSNCILGRNINIIIIIIRIRIFVLGNLTNFSGFNNFSDFRIIINLSAFSDFRTFRNFSAFRNFSGCLTWDQALIDVYLSALINICHEVIVAIWVHGRALINVSHKVVVAVCVHGSTFISPDAPYLFG